jgi:carbonic anhydrase
MKDGSELLAGYHRFRRKVAGQEPALAELARGQSPGALWIGCSDSRVIPEEITDADPGDLFVLRNIANVVPPCGTNNTVGSIIEFAVLRLHVAHIIVCGHTGCGGIAALHDEPDPETEPHLGHWIELLRPAADAVAALGLPEDEREAATVRANILLQRDNLLTYPCVQAATAAGTLSVSAALYTLESGEVLAFDDVDRAWVPLAPAD